MHGMQMEICLFFVVAIWPTICFNWKRKCTCSSVWFCFCFCFHFTRSFSERMWYFVSICLLNARRCYYDRCMYRCSLNVSSDKRNKKKIKILSFSLFGAFTGSIFLSFFLSIDLYGWVFISLHAYFLILSHRWRAAASFLHFWCHVCIDCLNDMVNKIYTTKMKEEKKKLRERMK